MAICASICRRWSMVITTWSVTLLCCRRLGNYAKTAEQIWLDSHPNYWSPTTALDKQVTYNGNQLNPWMLSYPVKGDASKDYAGGASS